MWKEGLSEWAELQSTYLDSAIAAPPPTQPVEPPPLPTQVVSDQWGWALVAAPILATFAVAFLAPGDNNINIIAAIVLNCIFLTCDFRILKRAGHGERTLFAMGLCLVPVYLWKRSRLLARNQLLVIAWCVSLVLSMSSVVGGLATDVAATEIDASLVEREIESGIREQADVNGATADCPTGIPAKRGESFTCLVEVLGEPLAVQVEVQNNAGDIIWHVDG